MSKCVIDTSIIVDVVTLVIAGVALVISILAYRRDRSRLKITDVEFRRKSDRGAEFLIWMINAGRRTVYVEEVFLRSRTGEKHHAHTRGEEPIPIDGDENRHRFHVRLSDGQKTFDPTDIMQVEAYDTARRKIIWRFPRKLRKKIRLDWKSSSGR